MSVDQGIGLVGIIATIILGLFAVKKVINRSRSQRQSVGKGSIGIQSGRDTKIDG
jgi:flagellar biogenesis protein FliO